MPIFDLYSKRLKRSRGEVSDVYVYDEIPNAARVQIVQMVSDAIGDLNNDPRGNIYAAYKNIVELVS